MKSYHPRDYGYHLDMKETAASGAFFGLILGGAGATVATVWGGYELGSVINDYFNITHMVGRGALDLVVMAGLAGPSYIMGLIGGAATGGAIGAATHPGIKGVEKFGKIVSKAYIEITGKRKLEKESDEPPDKPL